MHDFPIYFDYAASTPILPEVLESMMPYLTYPGCLGAPSSPHIFGTRAEKAIEQAREQIAAVLHVHPEEMVFTSGATESINLALKGSMRLYGEKRKRIVTMKTEHKAVLSVCEFLEKQGYSVTYLTAQKNGLVNWDELMEALTEETALCSILHVNNETGVIQPIQRIAEVCRERGILFHVDAAQSVGKCALDLSVIPVDLLSFTAHKCYGPKGVGGLFVRSKPKIRIAAEIHGGGQERNQRSGTLPVHQIVGMGKAFLYAGENQKRYSSLMHALRNYFFQELSGIHYCVQGDLESCVPNIINLSIGSFTGQEMLLKLPQFAFSTLSACQGKSDAASHVLRGMGYSEEEAVRAFRVSFGWQTTMEEVRKLAEAISNSLLHRRNSNQ